MIDKNWATVQNGDKSQGDTTKASSQINMPNYQVSGIHDPAAFFDSVDKEGGGLASMASSLRTTLAHQQQAKAQAQAQATSSMGMGLGGSGSREEDEK